jgi:hypothetical protein
MSIMNRQSSIICRPSSVLRSTTVENIRQIHPFYAKQSQFYAFFTRKRRFHQKTKPIQTQFNPIQSQFNPKQTQSLKAKNAGLYLPFFGKRLIILCFEKLNHEYLKIRRIR